MDELASEVAGASREQTQGITQINTAVGQMDKVTQSNAASAEESAAAAQELSSQAELMMQAVEQLIHLVGGIAAEPTRTPPVASSAPVKNTLKTATNGHSNHTSAPSNNGHGALSSRRSEIPMDDDFRSF